MQAYHVRVGRDGRQGVYRIMVADQGYGYRDAGRTVTGRDNAKRVVRLIEYGTRDPVYILEVFGDK